MDTKEIGKNIRILRFKQNLTQQELATKVGVSWEMISRYERGQSSPLNRLDAIAEALNTTPADILQIDYIASTYRDRSDLLIPYFTQKPTDLDFTPANTKSFYNAPDWVYKHDKNTFVCDISMISSYPIQISPNGPVYVSPTNIDQTKLILISQNEDLVITDPKKGSIDLNIIGSVIAQEVRFV